VTLRTKIVAALVLLAAGATVAIGVFSYTATAKQLRSEIDDSLDSSARAILARYQHFRPGDNDGFRDPGPLYAPEQGLVTAQVIDPNGNPVERSSTVVLPVSTSDERVLTYGPGLGVRRNVTADGKHYRMVTVSLGNGFAVQVARSLKEYDAVLTSLRNRTLVAAAIVMVVAAGIGWWIARQVTRRLTTLTNTAEEVAQTGQLDITVPVQGHDEAARLGVAFNEMLGALAKSKDDQQRLVQDAGHELRTPLTSLRTNMSVLRRHELEPSERSQVLDDLESETRELTDLVNELVELATDRTRDEPAQPVELAEVAHRVAERARRRSGRAVVVHADGTVVVGRRQGLERAISNLVDNALKFDESGEAPIEIVVHEGRVAVLDRGPGVPAEDMPHVFDRFFRSVNARSRPGSGLGLSIVREVAQRHGGTVFAETRPGGGAAIGFTVPVDAVAAAPEAWAPEA
jgi:two-component system sensor histidine kinase MprB